MPERKTDWDKYKWTPRYKKPKPHNCKRYAERSTSGIIEGEYTRYKYTCTLCGYTWTGLIRR